MALATSSSRLLASSRVATSGRRNMSQFRTPSTAGIARFNYTPAAHSSSSSSNSNHWRRRSPQEELLVSFSTLDSTTNIDVTSAAAEAAVRTSWELLATSMLAIAMSGSLIWGASNSNSHRRPDPSQGGSPLNDYHALLLAAPKVSENEIDEDQMQENKLDDSSVWIPWRKNEGQKTYDTSTRTDQGDRSHMEDEHLIKEGGRFAAVFDGHGGSDVSRYLRQHFYSKLQEQRKRIHSEGECTPSFTSLSSHATSIRQAFEQVEHEVCAMDYMCHQGSTAVVVSMHEEQDGRRTLLSANVGDSRAVLCRSGVAVDLTRDHKPNCDSERARLEAMGETVEFDIHGQCWRVRNLSISRAIGDRLSKPAVTGEVEIQQFQVVDDDEFVILASDGLWDVLTSQDAVSFVRNRLNAAPSDLESNELDRIAHTRRTTMSKELVHEALKLSRKYGPAADNICVVIVWLQKGE